MAPFYRVWGCLALALAAVAQETKHLEIDVIFPRNETYLATDNFPFALAVQNATALEALGSYDVAWDIMPYTDGRIPGGIIYDSGTYVILANATDSAIYVSTSNVTKWIQRKRRGERYIFRWYVEGGWKRCGYGVSSIMGEVMFGVEGAWELDVPAKRSGWDDAGKGKTPDILQVPECPALGKLVDITPSATASPTSCPTVVSRADGQGNPCAVTIDKAAASSISSLVSSLAKPTPTSTLARQLPSSTAAAEVGRPVQTALGVACLLGSVLLASCP